MSLLTPLAIKISLLGKFWQEPHNQKFFRWNLLFIFLQFAYLLFRFNDLPSVVPLYYSLPWGENQLAPASYLFILPGFSIIVILLNSLLAAFMTHSYKLLSYLLLIFSSVISALTLLTIIQIISLVT